MSPMSIGQARRPRWLLVLTGVAAWAMVAALLILEIAPATPTSVRGWVLLLVVGPPAYVASEFVMGRMFNPKLGARISSVILGRPPCGRDRQRQYRRKPARGVSAYRGIADGPA